MLTEHDQAPTTISHEPVLFPLPAHQDHPNQVSKIASFDMDSQLIGIIGAWHVLHMCNWKWGNLDMECLYGVIH